MYTNSHNVDKLWLVWQRTQLPSCIKLSTFKGFSNPKRPTNGICEYIWIKNSPWECRGIKSSCLNYAFLFFTNAKPMTACRQYGLHLLALSSFERHLVIVVGSMSHFYLERCSQRVTPYQRIVALNLIYSYVLVEFRHQLYFVKSFQYEARIYCWGMDSKYANILISRWNVI